MFILVPFDLHGIYYFQIIVKISFTWFTSKVDYWRIVSYYIYTRHNHSDSFFSIRLVLAASSRRTVWRHRTTILLWPNDRRLLPLWVRWLSRKFQPIRDSGGVRAAMPPSPSSTSSNLCTCTSQEWNLLPTGWQRTMQRTGNTSAQGLISKFKSIWDAKPEVALQKGELNDGLLFLTQPELGLGDGCGEGRLLFWKYLRLSRSGYAGLLG